jgi:hypothetical protein
MMICGNFAADHAADHVPEFTRAGGKVRNFSGACCIAFL